MFKEVLAENERLQKLVNHLQQERQDFIQAFSAIENVEHSVAPDVKPFQSNRIATGDSVYLAEKERVLLPDNRPQSHIPRFKDEKDFFNSFRDSKNRNLGTGSEESPICAKRVRAESTIPEEEYGAAPEPKPASSPVKRKPPRPSARKSKQKQQVRSTKPSYACNLI